MSVKIKVCKQYNKSYYVAFGYNGVQFGAGEERIESSTKRTAEYIAFEKFQHDLRRYPSLPIIKMNQCTYKILSSEYKQDESGYRHYLVNVEVSYTSNN